MESFYSNEGKYTLLDRTHHRPEGGGYENWIIEYRGEKFIYQADVRIPGLVLETEPWPVKREKVCVVEFYSEQNINSFDYFVPTNTAGYTARSIISCVADLTINVLEPIRNFRYVAIPCSKKMVGIYEHIINKLGHPAQGDIVRETMKILQPDLQIRIDSGSECCVVGDLSSNPEWKKRRNIL